MPFSFIVISNLVTCHGPKYCRWCFKFLTLIYINYCRCMQYSKLKRQHCFLIGEIKVYPLNIYPLLGNHYHTTYLSISIFTTTLLPNLLALYTNQKIVYPQSLDFFLSLTRQEIKNIKGCYYSIIWYIFYI
jgi:hypothetical protein